MSENPKNTWINMCTYLYIYSIYVHIYIYIFHILIIKLLVYICSYKSRSVVHFRYQVPKPFSIQCLQWRALQQSQHEPTIWRRLWSGCCVWFWGWLMIGENHHTELPFIQNHPDLQPAASAADSAQSLAPSHCPTELCSHDVRKEISESSTHTRVRG